jgi:Tol biopolymer transport system component
MTTGIEKVPALKTCSVFAVLTLVGFVVLAGVIPGNRARGSTLASPKVTSVTKITHDGIIKTNLLSDDSSLYITEWPAARHVVAKVSLQQFDRSLVPSSFSNFQALDLSPDHSRLLVSPLQGGSVDNEFWTLPLASGSMKRIGSLTGRDAAWSRDGELIAFGKGSGLYVARASGKEERLLFTAKGSVFAPRFSPDGQRIRFTVGDPSLNQTSLWEVGRDGSSPHALFANWQYGSVACCGNWTADGRYYIFQATQSFQTTITTLWASPDSGRAAKGPLSVIPLTGGPMSFGNVSPARDNKNLWAIGVQPAAEAVKYDAGKKAFVSLVGGVSATDLDFSSDGKWVAYVSIPESTLWRCRADGSDALQLTSAPEGAALPHWSPDGKRIAYVRLQPGQLSKIAVISADGGVAKELLPENRNQNDANWSPDGNRIMFGNYVHDVEGLNIRIVDVETHKIETIPGSEGLFSPRWSPDGKYIAALSPDFTTVMLFDFASRKWSKWLAEPAGAVSYPVWSADSKYLYFDDLVTEEESIRRVKVGDNHAERVFALQGIERYPGPFGLWSGQTPDGSWMFVRDRSTQEVYRLTVELP